MTNAALSEAIAIVAIVSMSSGTTACRKAEPLLAVPEHAAAVTQKCLDPSAEDYYFAPRQIDGRDDDSFIRQTWFRAYLRTRARNHSLAANRAKYIDCYGGRHLETRRSSR